MNAKRTYALVALAAALPISLAACGSTTTNASPGAAAAPSTSSAAPSTSSAAPSTAADAMAKPFGAGCAAVPADGKGSFNGMATDPVATAASHNPLLSTLVTAVGAAGLGDTLNSAPAITVFAPTNDAFAKIPADTLKSVLADKPTLTKILTNHVIAGKLSPDQLAGDHKTLAGTTLTVKGSGEAFTVGKDNANVICGNVQTANATVYIVDGVLMP
ncbi:fasciclin domain-containing protein [Lapillicoccus sp.]|uniref:fasciclin domain-containing protein n=1 Tax=Lapillicoccus sp. TaxID=1909287 RepID=UPI0027CED722|nr:fasciclin domain-containing protein [Actinomycetota bacterium]